MQYVDQSSSYLNFAFVKAIAPLYGTMRHELFQQCLRSRDFSEAFVRKQIPQIIHQNAEGLVACQVSSSEAETELFKIFPQLVAFLDGFTSLGSSPNGIGGHLERHGGYEAIQFLVENVESIEESLVSHELGLKGSADVLVEAKTTPLKQPRSSSHSSTSLACVELKTGHNQTPQTSHMAQLTLYNLLTHSRLCQPENNGNLGVGALLYINNEGVRAIHVSPLISELKSLIGQRNAVASQQLMSSRPRGVKLLESHCGKEKKSESRPKSVLDVMVPARLPEMLRDAHSCKRCYANRECMMYAASERALVGEQNSMEEHSQAISQVAGSLLEEDFAYFQKWDQLIDLEVDCSTSSAASSWLIQSIEREKKTGKCISALEFDCVERAPPDSSSPSIIRLRRNGGSQLSTSLLTLGLENGCHVILSTDDTSLTKSTQTYRPHLHIIRGIIDRLSEDFVCLRASYDDVVRLDKLLAKYKGRAVAPILFRMDRDEVATGVGTLRQNLINLFARPVNEDPSLKKRALRNIQLRRLLVHLDAPKFDNSSESVSLSIMPDCKKSDLDEEFCRLNPDQQAATKRVLTCHDYCIIQGLPGTGKTSTIAFIVRALVARGQRVLIASYTHSAVDNVLLKLIESGCGKTNGSPNGSLVRVGQKSVCHNDISPFLVTEIAKSRETSRHETTVATPESLRHTMLRSRVVGATVLSVPRSPLLSIKDFDFVIVDEAGQINQPAIIGALQAAGKFVLVGDQKQLPPLVQSELAEEGGFGQSMLERLSDSHPFAVSQLRLQYRMADSICDLSNAIMYNGDLRCADDSVAKRRLLVKKSGDFVTWPSWMKMAVDPDIPAVFVDTDNGSEVDERKECSLERKLSRGGSLVNDTECSIVKSLVERFLSLSVKVDSIGVICPFRAQLRILQEDPMLAGMCKQGLEISTIDRYQGRDKDVIILSMVRSNSKGMVGKLLSDARRLSVAVTRAKMKLVMVGSFSTLCRGSPALRPALERIQKYGGLVSFDPYGR